MRKEDVMNRRKFMASLGIGVASCAVAKANTRNPDEWMTVRTGRRDEGDIWVYCHIVDNRTGKSYRQSQYVKCDGTMQMNDRSRLSGSMDKTLAILSNRSYERYLPTLESRA